MFKTGNPAMKYLFIFLAAALFISSASAVENRTDPGDDSIIALINELYGKNITNGEYLKVADPDYLDVLRQNMSEEQFEGFCSRQKYWGNDHPELPYGANIWDENGPVNLSALNKTEKKNYGLESALIGGDGYVILGYMKREIKEGESVPFYKEMPDGINNFTCDLNWMNTESALKITLFAPDGMMGSYNDEYDGLVNGRIFIRISREEGIGSGEWYVVIEADKTEGDQPFMLLMY